MDMEVENALEELMFPGEKPHKFYIPEVADDLKPTYGQKFNSLGDAYDCFNRYAFKAGFSIRKAREVKKNGQVNWKEFVCSKEGESDDRWRKKKEEEGKVEERERGETRKECPAKLTVSFENPHYVVKSFIEEHSHPPVTPSRIHMLRSHRRVSTAKKNLVQTLSKVDIPIYKQFQVLETQAGGHENVGCTEKDLRNSVRDDRKEAKGHDVELLREHFKCEQEKDPDFCYQFHTDENQRLVRCFWADSNARKAYNYFGDVVVFDTTYNTNVYKMIFAPIVGVNHHGQTTVFGCAFLNNETFDSFVWLLETWVSAMAKDAPNAPIVIITDQDQAMTKAIAHVLPNTIHKYCIWHILKKMPEKTSDNFMRDHYDQLKRLIWDSESPEEFENRWFECLEKAQQLDNEWLKKMFDLRHRWIPAYVNRYFSAGMSSSQRVESAHAFFKHYCHKDNTLMDFVTRFNRALASQRNEELKADHKDLNETPILKLGMPMEIQMAKLYTNTCFMLFQTELYDCNGYMLILIADEENRGVYNTERVLTENSRKRTLVHDKVSNIITCSCKKFEFEGIPCRHILTFFRVKQIMLLPKEYILRRWTRFSRIHREKCKSLDHTDNSLMMRHAGMFKLASVLIDEAAISEEGTKLVTKTFEGLVEQIKKLNASTVKTSFDFNDSSVTTSEQIRFLDPLEVRAKGSGKRMQSWRDKKGKRKPSHCSVCRSTKHDKRTCPSGNRSSTLETNVNGLEESQTANDEL